jgi:L-ascorbate metabolism protein UlaG (beta-lactamase superfamily)
VPRFVKVGLFVAGVALALAGLAAAWLANDRPRLADYAALEAPAAPAGAEGVSVTFLGVSTLVIRDGATTLLVDGFFTRPGVLALRGEIAPDAEHIARGLTLGGVTRADAIFTVHSHYDHAMDVAEVAKRTGALVVGSRSTANVARGGGVPEQRIREAAPGDAVPFGAFTVRFVASRHYPLPPPGDALLGREIEAPLTPPAPVSAWLEGRSDSLVFEHPRGTLLVQGSAGYLPGALARVRADAVALGVGGLGRVDDAYRDAYWREIVTATGARRVFPVHWDDFTRPLGEALLAPPRVLDRFDRAMAWLRRRAEADGVALQLLPFATPVALY